VRQPAAVNRAVVNVIVLDGCSTENPGNICSFIISPRTPLSMKSVENAKGNTGLRHSLLFAVRIALRVPAHVLAL
jgi:hypothetical protein